LVAGCCDEEGASEGATHLLRTLPPPEALLIGEPSGVAGVTLGYKGIVKVRYTLEADAVHTGTPEPTVADRGMAFWRAVQEQVAAEQRADSLFRSPSARLLRINTSEAPGGRVRMALEGVVRTPPGFDLEGFEAFLQRRADGGAVHIPETEPAWEGDRNSSVARALTAAVRARGLTPRHLRKTGTSDANLLAPAWGVPCAAYGPGDAHLDHTPHERLALAEFREAVEVLGDAIERFAAWGGDPTRTDP
jgi:LysW-gamma-L-lysine carboxypeptidase